ncbi:sulfur carrier protein ThiS [Thermithiobacillus plumbiphilus]|uniref:Sulfur carrier protein ThiS n=1 Tax=Thermithiobacillus plumbiphilus TaxID=1729899 RepID=A0ABU9DAV8_9PROT
MRIFLNGSEYPLDHPITVTELLQRLDLAGRRVAVELNLGILPRGRHADTRLADGDRIEIVQAIGGG